MVKEDTLPVPDVTGQPAWVAVVLGVLGLMAVLGTAWLAAWARKSGTQEGAEQATLPASKGPDPTVSALQAAMDHLARVAERDAAESEEARKETESMRRKLDKALGQLHETRTTAEQIRRELDKCRAQTRFISRRALEDGGEDA